ncbi:MAG: RNA pseudouridine synthase [Clostridia bacterium]|nr:RNA pseudouridine synthase [Clostridia bacterium]
MIDVVLKTSDFVVVNKNVGTPSQSDPSGDKDAMTLCSEALRLAGERDELFLIHRLDRVVGGLLVFARNKKSAEILSAAVAERKLTKEYLAVVPGTPEGGIMRDYLYKDATLGKAFITDRKRAGVKEAELEYSVLKTVGCDENTCSLVRIKLLTGRFHQIRAQFASRKMPLIGDKKYGSRDFNAKTPSLFAARLSFELGGKTIEAKKLPDLTSYPWSLFKEEDYKL